MIMVIIDERMFHSSQYARFRTLYCKPTALNMQHVWPEPLSATILAFALVRHHIHFVIF